MLDSFQGIEMKIKSSVLLTLLIWVLAGCQMSTPQPITAPLDEDFTLEAGQSATITGTDLRVTFNSILKDERCPSDLECAASGPVAVSLSVQQGDGTVTDITLQTFTDYEGRSPEGPFEGIQDRIPVGDYWIRVKGVVPYPVKSFNEIKDAQYQVTLAVSRQ